MFLQSVALSVIFVTAVDLIMIVSLRTVSAEEDLRLWGSSHRLHSRGKKKNKRTRRSAGKKEGDKDEYSN